MPGFGLTNFAFGVVSGSFTTGQLTLTVTAGHGGRFADLPAIAVLWNHTLYTNPAEAFWAGFAEIIEIGSRSGDILQTLKRGQEGTSAIASVGTDEYRVAVTQTKAQWDKTWRASPDATLPFDAIESGIADAVTDAVARLVKSNLGTDKCLMSIQGGSTAGSGQAGVVFGDSTDGNLASMIFNRAASNYLAMSAGGSELARFVAGLGITIGDPPTATPAETLHVEAGSNARFDGFMVLPIAAVQTISAGVITVTASCNNVDTESAAATDDLDTINGGPNGSWLLLMAADDTHTVVVKNATGNILLGGSDFSLDTIADTLLLWRLSGSFWLEVSRSNNL